jgi:hypothetical protein
MTQRFGTCLGETLGGVASPNVAPPPKFRPISRCSVVSTSLCFPPLHTLPNTKLSIPTLFLPCEPTSHCHRPTGSLPSQLQNTPNTFRMSSYVEEGGREYEITMKSLQMARETPCTCFNCGVSHCEG